MDNLITSFIYHIRSIIADAKEYADSAAMEYSAKMAIEMPKLAQFLMWYPCRDKTLSPEEQDKQAYNILPVAQFPMLAQFLKGKSFDKKAALWAYYAKSSRAFALYLRPIMLAVPLIFHDEENRIVRLMRLIKKHYGSGKTPAAFKLPDDIKATIPEKMLTYLKRDPNDESVDPHLFEFYVYRKMHHHLDKGRLCCNDSISYCDIDHDLIDEHLVDDIEKIATKFGYPSMALFCDEHLDESLDSLDKAWEVTTERIKLGQNTGFKIKETQAGEKDWSLR